MLRKRQIIFAAIVVSTIGAAGCGSSNDDSGSPPGPAPSPASEIPPSAGVSVAAFISFLQSLASSETAEPLTLGTFAPPSDDVTEPQAL